MFIPTWIVVIVVVWLAFNLILRYSINRLLKQMLYKVSTNFESMDFIYNLKGLRIKGHLKEDHNLELNVIKEDESNQTA